MGMEKPEKKDTREPRGGISPKLSEVPGSTVTYTDGRGVLHRVTRQKDGSVLDEELFH